MHYFSVIYNIIVDNVAMVLYTTDLFYILPI